MEKAYQSSASAEDAILKFEADLRKSIEAHGIVEQELNTIRRSLLEMEIKRNELSGTARKGRENIRRIESELRTAKMEYWRLRNENL